MDFNNNDKIDDKTQDLNTYVNNICYNAGAAYYKGLRIEITQAAMRELVHYEKTLDDILEILYNGYDAPRKRKKGVIERWLDKGDKTFNIVIAKDTHATLNEKVWVLIHLGKFTRKKHEML